MHLKRLRVENFRAIERIDVEFDAIVNVIIGPNAIGKTTLLESVRLAKAVLAPRTQQETTQTLMSLGVVSPHMPQHMLSAALTNKPATPLFIKCTYVIEQDEVNRLKSLCPTLSRSIAQHNAGLDFAALNHVIAYLSSPAGQQAIAAASEQLRTEIARVEQSRRLELNLTIDFTTGQMSGEFPVQEMLVAVLERSLDPSKTLFSYFPADRALPTGEQAVQLGFADTASQLESYNSQPQLKYSRLKNTIFNSIIGGINGRAELNEQFGLVFDRILKGRELGEIGVNELGMLSIPIRDTDSGATFQIDSLSSGEKGLILTFLLIARNVEKNGLILLDEPELHLNPAVCRDLLRLFIDEYAVKNNMQGIICSHSAEILAGAFERPESCSLFHLKAGTMLAKVRQHDRSEIRDALRRLGSSESEALLYRGTISVEGIHDVEILQAGFDDLFRRYKIRERGGRAEVERGVRQLQDAERRGDEIGNHYFIFDHDGKPTSLANSTHVRLLQLNRFCLENYLLDVDILTDLSRNSEFSDNPKNNTAEMLAVMKGMAMAQLGDIVYRSVFTELGLEAICFDMQAMCRATPEEVSRRLLQQIQRMSGILGSLGQETFTDEYTRRVREKMNELRPVWDDKWRECCNGKLLLEEMRRERHFKGDLLKLKKAVMAQMRAERPEAYTSLENLLRDLISAG